MVEKSIFFLSYVCVCVCVEINWLARKNIMLILKFKLNNSNCNYNLIDKACLLGDNHVFQKNKQANLQYFFCPWQSFVDPDAISISLPENATKIRRNRLFSSIINGNPVNSKCRWWTSSACSLCLLTSLPYR